MKNLLIENSQCGYLNMYVFIPSAKKKINLRENITASIHAAIWNMVINVCEL